MRRIDVVYISDVMDLQIYKVTTENGKVSYKLSADGREAEYFSRMSTAQIRANYLEQCEEWGWNDEL